jgi:GTP cyclohydrolase I
MGGAILIFSAVDDNLVDAWRRFLVVNVSGGDPHLAETPERVVRAYLEMLSGLSTDPRSVLDAVFEEQDYDQMIVVRDIEFVSLCCHHLLPFNGKVHFGYLPDHKIVGLSKIPRLVEVLARRPQIQERLTQEIATCFYEVVQPHGCGVVVEAWHSCVAIRGVQKKDATMRTTALQGCFKTPDVKQEFLGSLR